jgi:SAM-dependent methyltransferase
MNPAWGQTRPQCGLCGHSGVIVHADQRDRLFGADGAWSFRRCANHACGLVWLDPLPTAVELKSAYGCYYTHTREGTIRVGLFRRILTEMEQGYWFLRYGYPSPRPRRARLLGWIFHCFPLRRRAADGAIRHLPAVTNGEVLDVGCGSGEWLLAMRERGWQVSGIDFDERAVALAQQSGLRVQCGTLEEQHLPSGSFDAIVMNHVVEHLPDPVGTLQECLRLLKPGGRLAIYTPNVSSLSHRLFQGDWRGLEPPRHLQVFSPLSLRRALEQAGFNRISLRPIIAHSVIVESLRLRWRFSKLAGRRWPDRLAGMGAQIFSLGELILLPWYPAVADCVNATATKR